MFSVFNHIVCPMFTNVCLTVDPCLVQVQIASLEFLVGFLYYEKTIDSLTRNDTILIIILVCVFMLWLLTLWITVTWCCPRWQFCYTPAKSFADSSSTRHGHLYPYLSGKGSSQINNIVVSRSIFHRQLTQHEQCGKVFRGK